MSSPLGPRTHPAPDIGVGVPAWWRRPAVLAGMVIITAALLALRKPWALHTPQLFAEDGSIFLTQDEQMGIRAWWVPYNGYLHILPRIIAWIASHTADPAWWPAIYNGCAFAVTIALFARLASARVMLPAKPWLMLAFVVVVGTSEVLINVTNLQWVTAFFLLLQLFTAPPAGLLQRITDLSILAVIGLNGPFAVVFAPLFGWRLWREKNLDALLALAVIVACAGVQGWFVTHGAPTLSLHEGSEPFRLWHAVSVTGSRLVTWPILGGWAVRAWPWWVHAWLGAGFIGALLVWSLRRNPLRAVRLPLAVAF